MKKTMLKIIILGDTGVGKTSLMNKYVNNNFSEKYKATIGADFLTNEIIIDNKYILTQIWDTAGQERFQSLGVAFYRGTDACVLVYDVNNLKTLDNLNVWKEEFIIQSGINSPSFPFLIVGNKSDISDGDSNEILKKLSKLGNYNHIKTSAKTGKNVKQAFQELISEAYKSERNNISYLNDIENVILSDEEVEKQNRKCC